MVVTDSRRAAVKYKKAIDAYIVRRVAKDASYNYRTLVAFSGSAPMSENDKWSKDWGPAPSDGDEFTDATMNPGAGADLACGCRLLCPCRSCGMFVLVEDAAESVASEDVKLLELAWFGERFGGRL